MKAKLIKREEGYHLFTNEAYINPIASSNKEWLKIHNGYNLSLKNCQAIELGYDLDELASERLSTRFDENSGYHKFVFVEAYKEGFQKALEILGDKKFSEEDINNAMNWIMTQYFEFHEQPTTGKREHYIQSLQQTEWDVEIEIKNVIDETRIVGAIKGVKGSGNKITTYKQIPKLDTDGCLILKRI